MGRATAKGLGTGRSAGRPALRVVPPPSPRPLVSLPRAEAVETVRPAAGAVLLVAGAGVVLARAALRRREARRAIEVSRNRAFAELLTAVRQRDDAMTTAAHDLRTPLTTLKGQAQLLQRFLRAVEGPDADRLRAGLAAIDAAATAAADRIDRLAEVSAGHPPSNR